MQITLVLTVLGVAAVLGDVAPYPPSGWQPQRALLVLPPQNPPAQNDTPQQVQDETENVGKLNENVMERLRQEIGSDTGVYYVYLPDGKLQKVQYTTAPVKQQDTDEQQQQYPDPRNYTPQQSSQYRQSIPATNTPQNNQQSNHQVVFGTNKQTTQGNQQQFSRYQAQQQTGESRFQQYAQYQPVYQRQQSPDNKEVEFGSPSQLLAQYNQPKGQNVPATSYVASVQFTDVPPITGPIFAYSPSPLVRVVRYANNYL